MKPPHVLWADHEYWSFPFSVRTSERTLSFHFLPTTYYRPIWDAISTPSPRKVLLFMLDFILTWSSYARHDPFSRLNLPTENRDHRHYTLYLPYTLCQRDTFDKKKKKEKVERIKFLKKNQINKNLLNADIFSRTWTTVTFNLISEWFLPATKVTPSLG